VCVQENYGRETFTKKEVYAFKRAQESSREAKRAKEQVHEFKREVERVRETARHPGGVYLEENAQSGKLLTSCQTTESKWFDGLMLIGYAQLTDDDPSVLCCGVHKVLRQKG
jgi:hypothetical protein